MGLVCLLVVGFRFFCRRVFAESWGLIARVRYDALVAIGAAIGGDTTVTRLAESCGASTAKCG